MKALRKEIIIKLTRIENQKCSINSKQAKYLYLTTKFFKWLSKRNETKVHFISVGSWNDSANISGLPYRFYFGFFGMESQNFAGYYSARICLIKEKEIGEK